MAFTTRMEYAFDEDSAVRSTRNKTNYNMWILFTGILAISICICVFFCYIYV